MQLMIDKDRETEREERRENSKSLMNKCRKYLVHKCIDCGPKPCEIDTK